MEGGTKERVRSWVNANIPREKEEVRSGQEDGRGENEDYKDPRFVSTFPPDAGQLTTTRRK